MPTQNKFEDEDLAISGRITKGRFNKKKDVKIVPIHDGVDKTPIDVKIENDAITHTYKLPKVPDGVASYRLTTAIEYAKFIGGDRRLMDLDVTVWPRRLKLTAKNETGGNAQGVEFVVTELAVDRKAAATDASGLSNYTLFEKDAGFVIKATPPWEILERKVAPGKLREIEFKVARRIKAKLVKPVPPGDASPIRQYVNLATTDEGRDCKGSKITLEVGGNGDPALVPVKGDKVFIKVTFCRTSERNDPEPMLLSTLAAKDVTKSKPDGTEYTGWVELGDAGAAVKFEVELGLAGGDTCEISVGGTKAAPTDQVITFLNWRRLFYELRFPRSFIPRLKAVTLPDGTNGYDYADDIGANVKTRLGEVFVDYQLIHSHIYEDAAAPAGTFMTGAYLGRAEPGPFLVLTSGWIVKSAGFSNDATLQPLTVYVNLCDASYSNSDTEEAKCLTLTSADEVKSLHPTGAGARLNFFPRRPANQTPAVKVTGFEWKAVIVAGAAAAPVPLAWETPTAPDTTGAKAGFMSVVERLQNRTLEVEFVKTGTVYATALAAGELTKLNEFLATLYADPESLRTTGVKFALIGPAGGAGDAERFTALKGNVATYHTGTSPKIPSHPGRDALGAARKGPMDASWLTHETTSTMRVKLPAVLGTATGPGAFVGPASATHCPVTVDFKIWGSGAINGNAGQGLQLMVLKDALPGPVSSTVCHELGHSMGMTVFDPLNLDPPPDLPEPTHVDSGGVFYSNKATKGPNSDNTGSGWRNLHNGPHCAKGVPDDKRADPKFDGWSPTDPANACIMWGSGGTDDVRQHFCDVCSPLIRARRLENIRIDSASRTP